MVVGTQITGGRLNAKVLYMDGSTGTVAVSKVDGSPVSDAAAARNAIAGENDALAMTKFFSVRFLGDGYELTELNDANDPRHWEDPVSRGDGTDRVATIVAKPYFANNPGFTDYGNTNSLTGWDISASGSTTFIVGTRGANGAVTYSVYTGFRNVPTMDVTMLTAICPNFGVFDSRVNTVAKYVYVLKA